MTAFGMANLRPEDTGLGLNVHVYKNLDKRARHGPRVKVYPGKFHEGSATTISVPREPKEPAEVIGDVTLPGRKLRAALAFVEENYLQLLAYWYEPSFSERDLVRALND